MQREVLVSNPPLDALIMLEHGILSLTSSFNALFFLGHRSSRQRRRFGALVLCLVNLAFLVQSLYFGLLPYALGLPSSLFLLDPRPRLLAGALPLLASGLISLLLLRQIIARRRR